MRFTSVSSPHLVANHSVDLMMRRVVLALIPGIGACFVFFGWGVLLNVGIAAVTAVAGEATALYLHRRPVALFLRDGSALVTAVLLALSLPGVAPWWVVAVSTAFAIVIAKQLFGGLGYNPFNPAMIGYVVALISFPRQMIQWPDPSPDVHLGLLDALRFKFTGELPGQATLDTITAATPLDAIKTELGLNQTLTELQQTSPVFGTVGGAGWEWIGLAFLVGGLWLLFKGVIRWHIPLAMLGGLFVTALVFHAVDSDTYLPPLFHLFSGGAMLGAFFIATDPVTASTTVRGRLVFGAGIGVITYMIRTWGGYPDGVAFAVLLMNMAVPTIDHYTQPRVFGARDE